MKEVTEDSMRASLADAEMKLARWRRDFAIVAAQDQAVGDSLMRNFVVPLDLPAQKPPVP